jgi:hypothetical protein
MHVVLLRKKGRKRAAHQCVIFYNGNMDHISNVTGCFIMPNTINVV